MHKGTFKTGIISRTQGQKKWHVSQISEETLDTIRFRFRQTIQRKGWRLSYHLQKKDNLTFSPEIIQYVIDTGDVVEYNETPRRDKTSRRILLRNPRDKYEVDTNIGVIESNLCVVVDIDDGNVVTAYWNAANDNHKTIDMHKYERVPLQFA